MEIKERIWVEKSGVVGIAEGCPGGLYLSYVELGDKKTVRILDGPPGLGVAVDFPLGLLYPLIIELIALYNSTQQSPMVTFMVRRENESKEN